MAFQIPMEVRGVFGSQTRAKILGYLANSSTPQTGYAISKGLQVNVSKVYGELNRLNALGILGKSVDAKGSNRYVLQDLDLRNFLIKRIRITVAEDWFSPEKVAYRRKGFEEAKGISVNLPRLRRKTSKKPRSASEFRRPPEKDRGLDRVRRASSAGTPR